MKLYIETVKFDGQNFVYLLDSSLDFIISCFSKNYSIDEIHLTLEPLFHPDIYSIVSLLLERELPTYIHTYGLFESDFPSLASEYPEITKYIYFVIEFNTSLVTSEYTIVDRIYKNIFTLVQKGYKVYFRVPIEFLSLVFKDLSYAVSEIGITLLLTYSYYSDAFEYFKELVKQIYYDKRIPSSYDHYIIPILADDINTINSFIDRGYIDDWLFERVFISFDKNNIVIFPTIYKDIHPSFIKFIEVPQNTTNENLIDHVSQKIKESIESMKNTIKSFKSPYPSDIFVGDVYLTTKQNNGSQVLLLDIQSLLKV